MTLPYDEEHRKLLDEFGKARFNVDPDLVARAKALNVYNPPSAPASSPKWSPYEKLKMRIGLGPGDMFGSDVHVNIFTGPNLTFVFVACGDKAEIFEDDVHLFPSDGLVGRFRLFLEAVT